MKRCLVFGGSGALGATVCRALSEQDARVAFTFNSGEQRAEALRDELGGAPAIHLDLLGPVTDIDRVVEAAATELGGIDVFVQCAGIAIPMACEGPDSAHRMTEMNEAGWDEINSINVKSTFFGVRAVIHWMREAGGGNIVITGSVDGVKPVPSPVPYAATKGALLGMTQAMAKELGEFGITVNMVAPGIMEDGISRDLPQNLMDEYVKHCGLKRVSTLSEVADLMVWLALRNTYITGQTILVDGAL